MGFALFSANKSKTGGALIAKLTYDNNVFLSLFKQVDFDQNDKKKNFDWKNPVNVKLSDDEVGDFLRVARTNGESKFYHKFEDNTTTGAFKYYSIPAEGEKPARSGFGLSVTKGESTVKVGFTLGAAERFAEYLRFCLDKSFESGFIDDLAKDKEYRDKVKKNTPVKPVEKKQKEEPTSNEVDPEF